jgi:hypothetical protein
MSAVDREVLRDIFADNMAKQIQIQCPREIAILLVEALQWSAAKHYPYGADECSIAARETLLEFAERFRQNS